MKKETTDSANISASKSSIVPRYEPQVTDGDRAKAYQRARATSERVRDTEQPTVEDNPTGDVTLTDLDDNASSCLETIQGEVVPQTSPQKSPFNLDTEKNYVSAKRHINSQKKGDDDKDGY